MSSYSTLIASVLVVALLGPLSAMTAPTRQIRSIESPHTRLLAGQRTMQYHSNKNCSSNSSDTIQLSRDFSDVIHHICNLVSYHDMIDSSDIMEPRYQSLKRMLNQSIEDTCEWIDQIAQDFPQYATVMRSGETCSVFLRKFCIRESLGWLAHTTYTNTFAFIGDQVSSAHVAGLTEAATEWTSIVFGDTIPTC